jgi:hypothetical protein
MVSDFFCTTFKKKAMYRILSFLMFFAITLSVSAQEALELHYKLKSVVLKDSYKKAAKEFRGGTMDFYLTNDKYRFDIEIKKQKIKISTIIDFEADSVVMYQELEKSGNVAYAASFKEVKQYRKKKETTESNAISKSKDFLKTGETRVIQGYTCEKSVGEEDGQTTVLWTTNNIKNPNSSKSVIEGSTDIPVMFSIQEKDKGIILYYTLKKLKTEISPKKQNIIFDLTIDSKYLIKDYKTLVD